MHVLPSSHSIATKRVRLLTLAAPEDWTRLTLAIPSFSIKHVDMTELSVRVTVQTCSASLTGCTRGSSRREALVAEVFSLRVFVFTLLAPPVSTHRVLPIGVDPEQISKGDFVLDKPNSTYPVM